MTRGVSASLLGGWIGPSFRSPWCTRALELACNVEVRLSEKTVIVVISKYTVALGS
jgi:hypothetical protein